MKILKEFSGYSGCKTLLMQSENIFVRKVSPNSTYNNRLIKQINKQKKFKNNILKTPKVFDHGTLGNLYYCDMEYIQGVSLNDYVKRENIKNIKSKFEKIFDFIENNNSLDENIEEFIINKIKSLQIGSEFNYYKDYCLDYDWKKVNKSYCHGDLTFENIIISNETIYLIDFLDSFVDTKVADVSKILQELYAFWSLRASPNKFNIKYIMIDEMLRERNIVSLASIKFLILNLLRIIPYSNKKDNAFLLEQMKYIIGKNK